MSFQRHIFFYLLNMGKEKKYLVLDSSRVEDLNLNPQKDT